MTASGATIRVIVVNYNGGSMTIDCLRAMIGTEWPREALEIVLVDNGSSDDVAARVANELPSVAVIRSVDNLGFAGGVNLGLRDLPDTTSYVAIVNNDLTVAPGWLRPLVDALGSGSKTGAACPKILFADQYEEIQILGEPARLAWSDPRRVTARVVGARIDGEDVLRRVRFAEGFLGPEFSATSGEPPSQWASDRGHLLLPARPAARIRELRLETPRPMEIVLKTDVAEQAVSVGTSPAWFPVPPSAGCFDVINNIGSEIQPDGYVRDRGYLEQDRGQYDRTEEVFAWCGAAAVLPAAYIRAVGVFDERLFAYYEDVDLSWRGHRDHWHYVTVPDSVVRHVHMATSSSSAPMALYYNERNRLLVVARYWSRTAMVCAVLRFLAITASYFRRDVVARAVSGRRPSWTITRVRLRALTDCVLVWCGLSSRFPTGKARWPSKV